MKRARQAVRNAWRHRRHTRAEAKALRAEATARGWIRLTGGEWIAKMLVLEVPLIVVRRGTPRCGRPLEVWTDPETIRACATLRGLDLHVDINVLTMKP